MLDIQQLATTLIAASDVSLTVLAQVVSVYPARQEAMCDAGALAVSMATGPFPGYGHVIAPAHATGWDLGRISQEHGTLVHRPKAKNATLTVGDGQGEDVGEAGELTVGDQIRIIPQHACLVCATFPWIYVVDGGDKVVDVWVPWKGW